MAARSSKVSDRDYGPNMLGGEGDELAELLPICRLQLVRRLLWGYERGNSLVTA
jgi:hypothetical protein